jgi:putative ABC transport system ATP-binding protein
MAEAPVFRLRDVNRLRRTGGASFELVVPELTVQRGEMVALVGESGCGKSTLLDLLAFVLSPSQAASFAFAPAGGDERDVAAEWRHRRLSRLGRLRARHIGYVMQTGGLLPFLTVRQNIGLSRAVLGMGDDGTVAELAGQLGIARHLDKRPAALSIGERQRVAVARALAHRPAVVVADEPTASVDPVNAMSIMAILTQLVQQVRVTTIVASHDWGLVDRFKFRRLQHRVEAAGASAVRSYFWG